MDATAGAAGAAGAAAAGTAGAGAAGAAATVSSNVETFSAPIGVIEPPPEIKAVVDRTADWIRVKGPEFEQELLIRNKGIKKFAFLTSASPYYAYYKQRLQYGAEGPPAAVVEQARLEQQRLAELAEQERRKREAEEAAERQRQIEEELRRRPPPLIERLRAQIKSVRTVKPMPDLIVSNVGTSSSPTSNHALHKRFHIVPPFGFAPVDLEIVAHTAQYVARNGQSFLLSLTARERKNPQFDFLRSMHPLYVYFQQLCDAYSAIIMKPSALLAEYRKKIDDDEYMLSAMLWKAKLKKDADDAEAKRQEEEEEERTTVGVIDWQSFVVVETIDFSASEQAYLPPPCQSVEEMTLRMSAQTLGEEDASATALPSAPGTASATTATSTSNDDADMDMDVDDDSRPPSASSGANLPRPPPPPPPSSLPPPPLPPPPPPPPSSLPASGGAGVLLPSFDETIEVRTGVDPAAFVRRQQEEREREAMQLVKCVVCGDMIAVSDLEEHLRIEMLDPNWKERKEQATEKLRESSLVDNRAIGRQLNRFAQRKEHEWEDSEEAMEARRRREKEAHERQMREDRDVLRRAAQDAHIVIAPPGVGGPPGSVPGAQPGSTMAGPATRLPMMPPGMAAGVGSGAAAPPGMLRAGANVVASLPMSLPPPPPPPPPPPGMPSTPHVRPAESSVEDEPAAKRARPNPADDMEVDGGDAVTAGRDLVPPAPAAPAAPAAVVAVPTPAPAPAPAAAPVAPAALLSEAEFLTAHASDPIVRVHVHVPDDASSPFGFRGQVLDVELRLTDSIDALKSKLATESHLLPTMPANKMKFQVQGGAHLNKDNLTFAHYNLAHDVPLILGVRERGGRKK